MRRFTFVLVLVATAVAVAACGDDDTTSTSPGGDAPWGRTFLADGPPPLRVSFTDDHQVAAYSQCNHLSGNATVAAGVLVVDQMGGTEIGCEPDLHAYDEWLAGFLMASPTITLDGDTLTLATGDDTLVLLDRRVADPDRALEGTLWVLDGIIEGETISSIPAGIEVVITFEGGVVEATGLCNGLQTSVVIGDATLEVEDFMHTEMSCGPDLDSVEQAVYATMRGTVGYRIEAASLRLSGPDGHGLALRAAE